MEAAERADEPTRDEAAAALRQQQVRDAIRTWSTQLVDLSGRNQLLYYRDLKVGTLDLGDADTLAVEALLEGRTVQLSRLFGPSVIDDRRKRARAIRNKAREALEERGIVTCFIALGMATWTNTTGQATPAAPVVLREVSIAAVSAAEDDFELALIGEPEINPTLAHLLKEQFAVKLPSDIDDLAADTFPQSLFDRVLKEAAAVPHFAISQRRVIGTFSYAKLPMVVDLDANEEALQRHDVVAAIAGNRPAQIGLSASGQAVSVTGPDRQPPLDEFIVLDADSSQSYAINAVVAGQSLVISGPPGTGKSQTIANLVATLVARGKSVLFVAEKQAAITAVLDRLDKVGLGDLVLDLHGGVGSRRALAESLAAGLRSASTTPRPDQHVLHEQLVNARNRLVGHDAAMHVIRTPWERSVFDLQCDLIDLRFKHGESAQTDIRLRGNDIANVGAPAIRQALSELHELASLGGLTLTQTDSPWAGSSVVSTQQVDAALSAAARLDGYTAPDTRRALNELLQQAGLRTPTTLADWTVALDVLSRVESTLTVFQPQVFAAPLAEMIAATATRDWRRQNPRWPGVSAGWGQRRKTRKHARTLLIDGVKLNTSDLHAALQSAAEVSVRWSAVSGDGGAPRAPRALPDARGRFSQLITELAALGMYLSGIDFAQMPSDRLATTLHQLAVDQLTLRKMPRINEINGNLSRLGLSQLLQELRSRRPDPELAVAILQLCWTQSVLDRIGLDDQTIGTFDAGLQDSTTRTFRTTDADHIHQAVARVRRAAAERLVRVRDEHDDQSTLVQAQASRKRGHLPLRQLFSAAPDVMTALKPCWAMSPLVVSQLLPADRPYFDIVVFDEASQIIPADAIPAILRARQVVVAGDRHQLPPTSFFAAASDGDDDVEQAVNDDGSINLALTAGYESILDVLNAGLGDGRTKSLTWHYRSRDERLIAFSNAWIYDNSLTTFPGIAGHECLRHVLVDQLPGVGQEDSVTAEVERVVELMVEHARVRPEQSLGVITMGVKHADRIESRLRDRLRELPELLGFFGDSRDERYFVKNLERVQGDERDAIILSIGYGKTSEGRLLYRFGPLLQEGGQRRLNVAITRARERMTLVSSFSHLDMDPNRSSAPGVVMLRAYFQYAASGGQNLGDVALSKPALNPFEISVRDRLVAAGIPITAQYGVAGYWIDFAAAHPQRPGEMVLAIEADGAAYHSSPTARDRDRLRQDQLERLGWTFHRIWSTDWFNDAGPCIERARAAYDQAVAASDAARSRSISSESAATPATATPVVAPLSPPRSPALCPVPPGRSITGYSAREITEVIRWIESDTLLRAEDELFEEFMKALGFRRRGPRIKEAFDRAVGQRH